MKKTIFEEKVARTFKEKYITTPIMVNAPGRINLIGEHTDYNEGFVLPAAIDKAMVLAIAENGLQECRLYSLDFEEEFRFNLNDFAPQSSGWANYLMGVVDQLQKNGLEVKGFDCVFGGNIPIGAGLSSSAALECGIALGLNELFELGLKKVDLVKIGQLAEHTFAGVQCGIMDQFASVLGKEGHVIRLDCRSLDYSLFPLKLDEHALILCDTQVKHSLADSAYNQRRKECEEGVELLKKYFPAINSLRDVDLDMLETHEAEFDQKVYKRCKYVVMENARVLKACEVLERDDFNHLGQLMYASHEGLSQLYEVSCQELDLLVEETKKLGYVLGSRMMGGGFGGCTLNLVEKDKVAKFEEELKVVYENAFGITLKTYVVKIDEGTRLI
ncbi:galactokinase [Litoribacter alkaliphilus]|uniref:Galactokinase n=1 Tax=Litoribacter ruber TaxID=702568 RepID=A0AAP2CHR5_9BACT|nr:galactokinase [Litoribacter alkaliphilus]MBS9524938.1 galactokinase [Litoribacter alkaliphilus]